MLHYKAGGTITITVTPLASIISGETHTITANASGTIARLRASIQEKVPGDLTGQGLMLMDGQRLEDHHTLAQYEIVNGSKLFLLGKPPQLESAADVQRVVAPPVEPADGGSAGENGEGAEPTILDGLAMEAAIVDDAAVLQAQAQFATQLPASNDEESADTVPEHAGTGDSGGVGGVGVDSGGGGGGSGGGGGGGESDGSPDDAGSGREPSLIGRTIRIRATNQTVEITGSNEHEWTFVGGSQAVARAERGQSWALADEEGTPVTRKYVQLFNVSLPSLPNFRGFFDEIRWCMRWCINQNRCALTLLSFSLFFLVFGLKLGLNRKTQTQI